MESTRPPSLPNRRRTGGHACSCAGPVTVVVLLYRPRPSRDARDSATIPRARPAPARLLPRQPQPSRHPSLPLLRLGGTPPYHVSCWSAIGRPSLRVANTRQLHRAVLWLLVIQETCRFRHTVPYSRWPSIRGSGPGGWQSWRRGWYGFVWSFEQRIIQIFSNYFKKWICLDLRFMVKVKAIIFYIFSNKLRIVVVLGFHIR